MISMDIWSQNAEFSLLNIPAVRSEEIGLYLQAMFLMKKNKNKIKYS